MGISKILGGRAGSYKWDLILAMDHLATVELRVYIRLNIIFKVNEKILYLVFILIKWSVVQDKL